MEALPRPPDGDQNGAGAMLAIIWTPFPLTLLFVSLRLLARKMIKGLGADDFFMAFAWVVYTMVTILCTLYVNGGGTRHLYYLTPQQRSAVIKLDWIIASLSIVALAAIKTSIALFMLRLIGPNSVWRKWFLYLNFIFIYVISIVTCVILFVQCNPSRALWENVPGARCWDPKISADISIFHSSYNIFLDVSFALLPISIIWNLRLSIKKKAGLCALLGLGLLTSIAAAMKTSKLSATISRADITWATFDLFAWSSSELVLLFIFGCVPAMKPLYDYTFKGKRFGPLYPWSRNPAYTDYPDKRSYQIHPDSTITGLAKTGARSTVGNKTEIRGHVDIADDAIGLNDITVQHTFNVESQENHHPRGDEINGIDHRSMV